MNIKTTVMRGWLGKLVFLLVAVSNPALAGEAGGWQADWDKTAQAAKKEGELVLYGSADFEMLFGEFHKKYPEIMVKGFSAGGRMLPSGSWPSTGPTKFWPIFTSTE